MNTPLKILAFDAISGLVAGTITLLAEPLLTSWYAWPEGLVSFFGWANIGYGCYSGALTLALRSEKHLPPWTVRLLILANAAWALHCFARAWVLAGSASFLGIRILVLEGFWVGALAPVEARLVLPHLALGTPAATRAKISNPRPPGPDAINERTQAPLGSRPEQAPKKQR